MITNKYTFIICEVCLVCLGVVISFANYILWFVYHISLRNNNLISKSNYRIFQQKIN